MPRHRLAVVLLVPPPVVAEIDGLRRAVGDPTRHRIPAHITLVPPVNVPAGEGLAAALAAVRAAAAATPGPLALTVGPAATFHPVTPVLYLAVGGDVDGLVALRDRVRRRPFDRPDPYDFVPHVTLTPELPADRLAAGVTALADYRVAVAVDRVHVLEEHQPGRIWRPIADTPFHPPAVVGRGGLPWELVDSQLVDPLARRLLTDTPPAPAWDPGTDPGAGAPSSPGAGPAAGGGSSSGAGSVAGGGLSPGAGPAVGAPSPSGAAPASGSASSPGDAPAPGVPPAPAVAPAPGLASAREAAGAAAPAPASALVPAAGDWAVTARDADGTSVGVAHGTTTGDRLDLAALVVDPAHRRLGVGRHLLAAVEALARRRSVAGITAAADPTGRFLATAGWRPAPGGAWHRTLGQ